MLLDTIQAFLPPGFRVPIRDWAGSTGDYGYVPIDNGDPRGAESLVKLAEYDVASEAFYARTDGQNLPYRRPIEGSLPDVWVRRGVAEKLAAINVKLRPIGVEIFVWDGYRPVTTQKGLWSFFERLIREQQPSASDAEVRAQVLRYVSDGSRFDPDNWATWPVHSCGGAVDLTLRVYPDGDLLDMGAPFDDMTPLSHTDALERAAQHGVLAPSAPALWHRRLLWFAMQSEGFVNYPLEYWHHDWGDQMYVANGRLTGQVQIEKAWYGFCPSPV
jgi:D-alanyl-D-alanine dipeptidase